LVTQGSLNLYAESRKTQTAEEAPAEAEAAAVEMAEEPVAEMAEPVEEPAEVAEESGGFPTGLLAAVGGGAALLLGAVVVMGGRKKSGLAGSLYNRWVYSRAMRLCQASVNLSFQPQCTAHGIGKLFEMVHCFALAKPRPWRCAPSTECH
jgi:hypothetical protein